MLALREKVRGGGESVVQLFTEWRMEGEATALNVSAQVGLLISQATMQLEAGRLDDFYDEIYDAYMYATNVGLVEVADLLRGIVTEK